MPAARAERGVLRAKADAHGGLEAGGNGGDQGATVRAVALADSERRRHDLRRGVAERRPVDVAHGDRSDQVTVEQRGAGERELLAADDGCLARGAERAGEAPDLSGLVAQPP